jgi:hypothetical protein
VKAQELEQALIDATGEWDDDRYDEYWEEYTGINGFYHLLAGTDHNTENNVTGAERVSDGLVEVDGLGTFTRVETLETNFDTYEKSWDNFLVFKHKDELFRVQGYLDSWGQGAWDGRLEKVEPVEVTKIEYRRVND